MSYVVRVWGEGTQTRSTGKREMQAYTVLGIGGYRSRRRVECVAGRPNVRSAGLDPLARNCWLMKQKGGDIEVK